MAASPSQPAGSRPRRFRLHPAALALPAVLAALLPVRPLPESVPAAPAALPPEIAALLVEDYDLNTAFNLAGEQVPPVVQEYYFLALTEDVPPERDAFDLAETLRRAAQDHDYLGLTGPDPRRNRRALLTALDNLAEVPLQGLIVIYVGPVEQQDEIVAVLRRRGIEPRFVVYPRGGLPV
jgi:hypothetical protein